MLQTLNLDHYIKKSFVLFVSWFKVLTLKNYTELGHMDKQFAVKVEEGRKGVNGEPSIGPVYRNPLAKDGFPPLDFGLKTTWDVFR